MMQFISRIPWALIIIACLTVGLIPYNPPHVWQKTVLMLQGRLVNPADLWDLFFHALPWILLVGKVISLIGQERGGGTPVHHHGRHMPI
ncbi:MAG: RND transporter [Spirochaetes bacterium]|nr:RND transporter [Spirochaetota bacterium]